MTLLPRLCVVLSVAVQKNILLSPLFFLIIFTCFQISEKHLDFTVLHFSLHQIRLAETYGNRQREWPVVKVLHWIPAQVFFFFFFCCNMVMKSTCLRPLSHQNSPFVWHFKLCKCCYPQAGDCKRSTTANSASAALKTYLLCNIKE